MFINVYPPEMSINVQTVHPFSMSQSLRAEELPAGLRAVNSENCDSTGPSWGFFRRMFQSGWIPLKGMGATVQLM